MTTWFTADLHLGHANIIRYCNRPFADVEAMNDGLVERWNAVVAPDDEVWVLGDVAMGKIDENLPRVRQLHGRKRLLTGNHDRCWDGRSPKGADPEWVARYLDAGFDEIHHGQIDIEIAGTTTTACHFPYRGDSHDHDRYAERRPVDHGRWLVHGHVHNRWRQEGRMINVGTDAWDYRPVSEAELAALMHATPLPTTTPLAKHTTSSANSLQ